MAHPRIKRARVGGKATFAVALAAIALTFAGVAPASALPIDQPLISAGGSDFGANLVNGVPLNGGVLDWNQTAGNPVISPRLTGTYFMQYPAGVQGHIEIGYYNASHTRINTRVGGTKTSTAAATDSFPINLGGFGNASVEHVHVEIWDNSSGVMALRGWTYEDL